MGPMPSLARIDLRQVCSAKPPFAAAPKLIIPARTRRSPDLRKCLMSSTGEPQDGPQGRRES